MATTGSRIARGARRARRHDAAVQTAVLEALERRRLLAESVWAYPGADGHLARGVVGSAASPRQGRNDFGDVGWGGPCPPSGTHHYRFTLTALSAPLGLGDHPGGSTVRAALAGAKATELGKATLTATSHRG